MCVNVCSKVYHTIYYLSVCSCVRVFLYLYVYMCACVLHTCLSVSLKCLTVLSCPQSVKSRRVETSKKKKKNTKESQIEGKVDRKHQRQEVLLWISSRQHSVFNVFISYAYSGVVLMLFVWPPCRQEGDSRPARGGVI